MKTEYEAFTSRYGIEQGGTAELKISVHKLLCYALVISLICSSSVMWHYVLGISFPGSNAFKLLFLIVCVCIIIRSPKYKRSEIISVILVLAYLAVYLPFTLSSAVEYVGKYVVPMVVLILLFIGQIKSKKLNYLFEAYANVIFIIAFVSLFFWLFGTVLNVLPGEKSVYYYWASRYFSSTTYGYIYFKNPAQYTTIGGITIIRNVGIWTEAPAYSSRLFYGLIIELLKEKKNKLHITVLILALISTLSTKSYIVLLEIALIYYLYFSKTKGKGGNKAKYIGIFILILIVAAAAYQILVDKSSTTAYEHRMESALAGLNSWLDNIFFGVGYSNTAEILTYLESDRVSNGISMGLTTMLGQVGLYLSCFVLYPYFALLKYLKKTKYFKSYILIAVVSFTDLIISNIYSGYMYMAMVAVGYSIIILKNSHKLHL